MPVLLALLAALLFAGCLPNSESGGSAWPEGETVLGSLDRPGTAERLTWRREGESTSIWTESQEGADLAYATKHALSACEIHPAGDLLWCLEAGELVVISLNTGAVQSVATDAEDARWRPTGLDLIIIRANSAEQLGFDLSGRAGPRQAVSLDGREMESNNRLIKFPPA